MENVPGMRWPLLAIKVNLRCGSALINLILLMVQSSFCKKFKCEIQITCVFVMNVLTDETENISNHAIVILCN